jgi:uncharacterized membrane protein
MENFNEQNSNEPIRNFTENSDSSKNDKVLAVIAYIIFFIPLLKENRSDFLNFHTNQGTLFFLFALAGHIVLSLIPVVGWLFLPFFSVTVFIFFVIAVANVLHGKTKELPWFGHFKIID